MGNSWKKKYKLIPDKPSADLQEQTALCPPPGRLSKTMGEGLVCLDDIYHPQLGKIFTSENMKEIRRLNPSLSMLQFEKLLDERLASRIKLLCSDFEPDDRKVKLREYKKYFHSDQNKWTEPEIYAAFLKNTGFTSDDQMPCPSAAFPLISTKQLPCTDLPPNIEKKR